MSANPLEEVSFPIMSPKCFDFFLDILHFIKEFGPCLYESITQFLQIGQLQIYDANLPFQHIPNGLYWIEIW